MTRELLQSVVLYLASSSAQVWGTLMVFHVLLMRDLCLWSDQAIDQEDRNTRPWLDTLLVTLRDPQGLKGRLAELGLDADTVAVAETDRDARVRIIQAVRRHQAVVNAGIPYTAPLKTFSPRDLQSLFDRTGEKIERIQETEEEPNEAFYVGLTGVAVNLLLLSAYALGGDHLLALRVILGTIVLANVILGAQFARQIHKALTCYF